MRNITIKKIKCLIAVLVMGLSLCITAFAEEPSRIEIIVEGEADIVDFIHSTEYDPDNSYSFIIKSKIQVRILCPGCGKNGYRGITEHRDSHIHPRPCPAPDLEGDMCYDYNVYTYSKCDYCGYRTSCVFLNRYWIVECHTEMPDGWGTFIARPGQSYQNGYDFHEDPVYMGLSDCLP